MKYLIAEQCKTGWYVRIIDVRNLSTLGDVQDLARHEGLINDQTPKNEVFIRPFPKKEENLGTGFQIR